MEINAKPIAIEWQQVPEVAPSDMFEIITAIRRRELATVSYGSFGMFVVRQVSETQVERIHDVMQACRPALHKQKLEFTRNRRLHRDPANHNSGAISHVTAGSIEVMMLMGSEHGPSPADEYHYILRLENLLYPALATEPLKPLRVQLEAGDAVLFDECELHYFYGNGGRTSTSRWMAK